MALTAYLAATNRLLQNPVPANPLYSTADLTAYINEGRQQLAADAQCIRAFSTANLITSNQIYPFSLFNSFSYNGIASGSILFSVNPSNLDTITLNGIVWTFVTGAPGANQTQIGGTTAFTIATLQAQLSASGNASLSVANYSWASSSGTVATLSISYKTLGSAGNAYTLAASVATPSGASLTGGIATIAGIQAVMTIRQMAVSANGTLLKLMTSRPWAWFNRYNVSDGVTIAAGVPNTWAQQGLGTFGTFGVSPVPASNYSVQADCVLLPIPLVDDTTAEAIPYPFTDCVPYYAAYKAYLSSQKTQDATTMFGRYKEFVKRAVEMTSPSILPLNYQGGVGSQIAASKQSLTEVPTQSRGGQ